MSAADAIRIAEADSPNPATINISQFTSSFLYEIRFHRRERQTAHSFLKPPTIVVVVDHVAGHAAVDADVLAGDEARLVGGEI